MIPQWPHYCNFFNQSPSNLYIYFHSSSHFLWINQQKSPSLPLKMCFLIILFFSLSLANATNQTDHFFSILKTSLSGPPISNWKTTSHYCNYTGIKCNPKNDVVRLDLSHFHLSGKFPDNVCSFLPKLRVLRIGDNHFYGGFPRGITNCTFLQELNTSSVNYTGPIINATTFKGVYLFHTIYKCRIMFE